MAQNRYIQSYSAFGWLHFRNTPIHLWSHWRRMGGEDSVHPFPTVINGKVIGFRRKFDFQYLMKQIRLPEMRIKNKWNQCKWVVPALMGSDELLPRIRRLFVQRIENKCLVFVVVLHFPEVFVDYHKSEVFVVFLNYNDSKTTPPIGFAEALTICCQTHHQQKSQS